jgi:hypothetical protein
MEKWSCQSVRFTKKTAILCGIPASSSAEIFGHASLLPDQCVAEFPGAKLAHCEM